MNELIIASKNKNRRWRLLTTVSAGSLLLAASAPNATSADQLDKPTVWIELGGQLNRIVEPAEPFVPPFSDVAVFHGLPSPVSIEAPPNYGFSENLAVMFQPSGTSWSFSVKLQYGKSNKQKSERAALPAQSYSLPDLRVVQYVHKNGQALAGPAAPSIDYTSGSDERHTIVDFQVGKDVGLGIFGSDISSKIEFGVRFAQLTSNTKPRFFADPYPHMTDQKYIPLLYASPYSNVFDQYYKASPLISRSFRGFGPSLSWNGSVPILDISEDTSITLDWGANVGLLFGRQKAKMHHDTVGTTWAIHLFPTANQSKYETNQYFHKTEVARSRSVTVPNVGGLIGASLNFPNAKVSFGYRADFFFGAMDGGVDVRHVDDVGFHGPFATVSIGLGG